MQHDKALGFVELGKSYLDASRALQADLDQASLRLRFEHPVDLLFAHALELMLKGCILDDDPGRSVEDFGHNLARLYASVRRSKRGGPLIRASEKAVRNRWRDRLRGARDDLQSGLGLPIEAAKDFGVLSNAEIGSALDELDLRRQVYWASDRHSQGGSMFRYLVPGLYSRDKAMIFGLNDDVFRLSIFWGCEELHRAFVARWREQRQAGSPGYPGPSD
ncbi:hypothetical protein [Tabrizicola aquatica]|uniref:hypothetical protein n=1 Tax=Tabrizicola aquatica TaxID=909926 RepID=UPI000CD1E35D|nr:hypothetical protein [Tabrizicola aquatica]